MPRTKFKPSPALIKKIHTHRSQIAAYFREMIKAQMERWDYDRKIEKLLGVEISIRETVENWAAAYDTTEDIDVDWDTDEAVRAVIDSITSEEQEENEVP